MHEYTAALRVSGDQIDIAAVTKTLGVQPTHIVQIGEAQQGGPAKKDLWSFEALPAGGGEWKSLEDALSSLLSQFADRTSGIRRLQMDFDVYFWCGHFSSSFNGGPTLSAALLRSLGEFGVELRLDTYFSESQ